jgi:hypothetical protein
VTIDTSQNVGIGTGSPARKLVVSNAGAQGFEFGAGVGLSSGNELLNYNRSTSLYVPLALYASTHTLYAGTSGATLALAVDTSGNLSLNSTSSVSKLYLKQPNNNSSTAGFTIENSANDTRLFNYFNVDQDTWVISATYDVNGAYKPISWYTSDARRMTLDTSGNLGVGTASPAFRLDVQNATSAAARIATTTATASTSTLYLNVANNFSGVSQAYIQGIGPGNSGISQLAFGTAGAAGDTTATERVRITSGGNVGIGLSTPQYRLSLGTTVGRKLAIYEDGTSGGVAAGFGTDLSGSAYELSSWAGSPGGGNGVFTWGQVNTTNGAFTERMRIDTSGNVLVGMSSFSSGGIERTIAVSGNASAGFQLARVGAVAAYIYSYGSVGFRVETTSSYARVEFVSGGSGGVQLASAGATSWTSLSDERTKTDLVPITDAVQKVSSLRAVTGRFIKDGPETSRSFLIAQDFVDVFPQAVSTFKEKDDDTEYLGLAYTDTIPLLVAAIKEQQALIESLTQRIAALEGQ